MINDWKQKSIVVTGAAGFIGSCLVSFLNENSLFNLILVDEFSDPEKSNNLQGKRYRNKVERDEFFNWLHEKDREISAVFHIGARTDTTEFDYRIHDRLNVIYSKNIWQYCADKSIPLIYASSAATYGDGSLGYDDDHALVERLQPLNPYGVSKNEFDKWVLAQSSPPPFWAGLKFFNVYGPNEYHKARMASVIFHSFQQIKVNGFVKLFKSHRNGFRDGEQLRDFVYVKDVISVCYWLMNNQPATGIYNLGTGKARTFNDLVKATFAALDLEPKITYIDMPEDIRDKYQYFTEANMQKLRSEGYTEPFYSLEDGIDEYVRRYLSVNKYY
jgi:ADP-L-glycero-D-manno-heptose 6-epimerase